MKEITSYFRLFLLIIAAAVIFMSCNQSKNRESKKLNSLELVKKQGKLVAVTDYNSTNYFIYRGEPMGYQYELLNLLANHLGVKLEVMVNNDISENFKMLSEKKCDIIAINLTITKERSQNIDFTIPHSQTRQVLVQKKPDNWEKISAKEIESMLIRNQLDLAGKTVHVQKESSYATRIKSLSDEIGDSIKIIEMVDLEVEQLIELVAKGEIEYTIADENVALVNQTYFPR